MAKPAPLLIIGAGPSGLAVARALGEAGLDYVQAEASHDVGGNWAHGVYETAHIISSRRTTEYTDYPMPADWPDFPSAQQMHRYFQDYARHYGLMDKVRFGARVSSARQDEAGWEVRFEDGAVERFRAVIVCNGHHWARSFPGWVSQFGGELLHSKDYKRPDQLAGKRVLVLGGGNSGCDIASESARVSASADWSLRRGYWFLPKTLFGRPSVELISPWVPVWAQRLVLRALIPLVLGRYSRFGLPEPDHRIYEAHPTVNTEVFHYLSHGRLKVRPDVVSAEGSRVRFKDGAEADYDLVVCATGYDVAFPFLEDGLIPIIGKTPQLTAGLVRPEVRGLYIVGAYQARYGIGPLLRPLAQLIAALVQLEDELTVPVGALLARVGQTPPVTHLVEPHQAIRRMKMAMKMMPVLRWRARRFGWMRGATKAAG